MELVIEGVEPIVLAVQDVAGIERVTIRPVPAATSTVGPYGGAVLRRNASLSLVIDPALLVARAWALVA